MAMEFTVVYRQAPWSFLLILSLSFGFGRIHAQDSVLEEILRIGTIEGDVALSPIRDVTVGEGGELFVTQQFFQSVTVFSREGKEIRRIGRGGQGPGEFRTPGRLGWIGDTLWVLDFRTVHFFDPNGSEVDQVSLFLPGDPTRGIVGSWPVAALADGTLLVEPFYHPNAALQGLIGDLPIQKHDRSGDLVGKLASMQPPTFFPLEVSDGSRQAVAHLVQPRPHYEVTVSGDAILIVDQVDYGPDPFFRLLRISIGGDTLLSQRIPFSPRRIDGDWTERLFDLWTERIESNPFVGWSRERLRDEMEQSIVIPEFHPPVSEILSGADGTIWLNREPRGGEENIWEVLSESGETLRRLELPDGFQPLFATREEVWGESKGPFDVPSLVGYRIH